MPEAPRGASGCGWSRCCRRPARAGKVIILRAGDFYGPDCTGEWFDQAILREAGGQAAVLGRPGVGHSWAYLPDLAGIRNPRVASGRVQAVRDLPLRRPFRRPKRWGPRSRPQRRCRSRFRRSVVDPVADQADQSHHPRHPRRWDISGNPMAHGPAARRHPRRFDTPFDEAVSVVARFFRPPGRGLIGEADAALAASAVQPVRAATAATASRQISRYQAVSHQPMVGVDR